MKNIIIKIGATLVLIASLIVVGYSQNKFNELKADSILNALVENNKIIGGVAAVSVDGGIVWKHATGWMDKKLDLKFEISTKNRTASIAKSITAVAVMQLVEAGKLDLDLPIQEYIPDYPKSELGDITMRHLLNHTSGVPAYASMKETETVKSYHSLKEAISVFENRELLFKPGTKYKYTTYGYVVIGRIIEAISRQSYGEYIQENIFDKAGMKNSGIEVYKKKYENKSLFYHRKNNGKIFKINRINNLSNRIPGGGFYSTAGDMIAFGNAVLDGTLLSSLSLKEMWTDGGVRKKDDGNPYAKGWFLYGDNPIYGQVIGHSGGQTGTSTQLMILPDINAVVIVMANTSGAWSDVVNTSIGLYYCLDAPESLSSN